MHYISVMAKLNFQQLLLPSSVSHDPSQINTLTWCSRNKFCYYQYWKLFYIKQDTFYLINRKLKTEIKILSNIINVFPATYNQLNAYLLGVSKLIDSTVASRCRRGWFGIGSVIDHNRYNVTEAFLTSFVTYMLVAGQWRREARHDARIIKNAPITSKSRDLAFMNNLVSTTWRRHAVCKSAVLNSSPRAPPALHICMLLL